MSLTETRYLLVDPVTGTKRAVPASLAAELLAGAPGRTTDRAGVGGGRVRRVVPWVARTTMPWKNGGGITHELVREARGEGFALRLSIAEVASDGPFSAFPGIDRVITVIDGAGMTLTRSDGLAVTLRPGAPFAFHGEDAYTGALVGGAAARDFNVLVARDVYAAAVAPTEPGRVRATWLLALAAGRVGGVAVERWDLAELDGDVMSEVAGLAVTITGRESGRAEGEPPRGAGPSR